MKNKYEALHIGYASVLLQSIDGFKTFYFTCAMWWNQYLERYPAWDLYLIYFCYSHILQLWVPYIVVIKIYILWHIRRYVSHLNVIMRWEPFNYEIRKLQISDWCLLTINLYYVIMRYLALMRFATCNFEIWITLLWIWMFYLWELYILIRKSVFGNDFYLQETFLVIVKCNMRFVSHSYGYRYIFLL